MKLSATALSILLTKSRAFTPTPLPSLHTRLHSTPPPESSSSSSSDLPEISPEEQAAIALELSQVTKNIQPSDDELFSSEIKAALGQDALEYYMGVDHVDDIDPYNPEIWIRPRPGKYGWRPVELTKEYRHAMDAKLDEYKVPPEEKREELLKYHVEAYQEAVNLAKAGSPGAAEEWRNEADATFKLDPWFGLNERLMDAVKVDDAEEVQHLKTYIDKVGGPPASLKDKVNEEGFVPLNSIYAVTLSNERLRKMIMAAETTEEKEYDRQFNAIRQLESIQSGEYHEWEDQGAWEEYAIQKSVEKGLNYLARVGEEKDYSVLGRQVTKKQEEMEKERKELMAKWRKLGKEESPEEVYIDWTSRKQKLNEKLTTIAEQARREDSLYEEDDEFEYDEDGLPIIPEDYFKVSRPKVEVQSFLEKQALDSKGNPRPLGDEDVLWGELDPDMEIKEGSICTTGPLTVEVNSNFVPESSDPVSRKYTFQYNVRITNNSDKRIQLIARSFSIQNLSSKYKDVLGGMNITGRQPIIEPGESFEYNSLAPLSTRPLSTTIIAARMSGEYAYCELEEGQETATEEQIKGGKGDGAAKMGMFHFVFPEDQRVKKLTDEEIAAAAAAADDDEDEEYGDDDAKDSNESKPSAVSGARDAETVSRAPAPRTPPNTLPGDPDITSGNIAGIPNDSSNTVSSDVRVECSARFVPEKSDPATKKYCFAYDVRITNEKKDQAIQLVSRRFEIQNIGSQTKDVVQGANVTGRQPILKPGAFFEYTSSAPLSVSPMLDKTQVLSRMCGEYNCVLLADDGVTPLSSTPLKAELGTIHFILPEEQNS